MRFTSDDSEVEHVVASELRLHDPTVRRSRVPGELLDPEFHEFGVSGRVWDRESVLDLLRTDAAPAPTVDRVAAGRIAPDVILVTYRARRPERTALRSSIWRRRPGGPWRIYFHQGTALRDLDS